MLVFFSHQVRSILRDTQFFIKCESLLNPPLVSRSLDVVYLAFTVARHAPLAANLYPRVAKTQAWQKKNLWRPGLAPGILDGFGRLQGRAIAHARFVGKVGWSTCCGELARVWTILSGVRPPCSLKENV